MRQFFGKEGTIHTVSMGGRFLNHFLITRGGSKEQVEPDTRRNKLIRE